MDFLGSWLKRDFFIKAASLYMLLLLMLGIVRSDSLPSFPIVSIQITYLAFVVLFSQWYSKVSINITLVVIFLFQIVCGFGLRFFNIYYFNNPFGDNAIDSLLYEELAKMSHVGYHEFLTNLFIWYGLKIDDYGFPSIIYFVYNISGHSGREAMLFLNAGIVTWSSYYLYKTTSLYFDKNKSLFICFFWGIQAFAVRTAACGLKENFFVFFMVAAMYYLCRIYKKMTIKDIAFFFVFMSCILMFRIALFYAFLATFFVVLFVRVRSFRKYIWLFVLIVLALVYVYSDAIIGGILEQRGWSYETLEYKQETKGSGLIQWITNISAALIGPFPSFVADAEKRNYITLWSFTPYCKMLFSGFFVYGVWYAIKMRKTEFFPFILMWAFNTIMIVTTFFSLHDRFQWPHVPYVLVLSCLGYEALINSKNRLLFDKAYLILVVLLIFFYNLRA